METKVLPARSTRGRRMTELVGEEQEADEAFWNAEVFQDDDASDVYMTESDEGDMVESDFDISESSGEEQEVEKEPAKKKQKGVYIDPALQKKKAAPTGGTPVKPKREKVANQMSSRKSSRSSALKQAAQLQQKEEEEKKKTKVVRHKVEYKRMTQEEMLEEAKETERLNVESLERILVLEEQKKKRAQKPKGVQGPKIQYRSRVEDGKSADYVTFSEGVPEFLVGKRKRTSSTRQKCAVTGEPARYFDPVTKKPYATLEAFTTLRKQATA